MAYPQIDCQKCSAKLDASNRPTVSHVSGLTMKTNVSYDCMDCCATYTIAYVEQVPNTIKVHLGEVDLTKE